MIDNVWWIFFSCTAGIGFFVSLLLLTSPSKIRPGMKPLVLVLLLFSLTLVQFVILWTKTSLVFPHLHNLWQVSNFWYGPLLFCFFRGKEGIKWKKWWPHFVLGILLLLMWLPYGIMPTQEKVTYLEQKYPPFYSDYLPSNYLLYLSYWWVSAIIQALYAAYFLKLANSKPRHGQKIEKLVANLFVVFVLARSFYFLLLDFGLFNQQWDYAISLTMSYCIFRIGLLSYHKPEYFFLQKVIDVVKPKYSTTSLSSEQSVGLAARIKKHIEEEKVYLKPSLRLPDLSAELDIKPHHISQAINEQFNCSFSDYINGFRIKHACHLLTHEKLSAKEVGYQSGFNNLATFYKAFKKQQNTTPAKFRDDITDER